MGKVVMVISAAVTAFVLTITAGALYTYKAQTTSAASSAPSTARESTRPRLYKWSLPLQRRWRV